MNFGVEHPESRCPLRTSSYCSYCAKYGHITSECPAPPSRFYTQPAYMEQLISPIDLDEYKIVSKTPLAYVPDQDAANVIEVKDSDQAIMAYLTSCSIKFDKGTHRKQVLHRKHLLEEYADRHHMRVIYIK